MRVRLVVRGTVQGVGFRPFVHRTARSRGLTGWVRNTRDAVHVEVQGNDDEVRSFMRALDHDLPAPAIVRTVERTQLEDREETSFQILESEEGGVAAPVVPPDLATCPACFAESTSVHARRHRYPFTNCASCGPRYSLCTALPYDRQKTSMRSFAMCSDCAREYEDIDDRRHHAQPIACPTCGPALSFLTPDGRSLAHGDEALGVALRLLDGGSILALRGIGGFQLLCKATDARVVSLLRVRKQRPDKPFAVMFRDFDQLATSASVSDEERTVLASPEAPIVLVVRRPASPLAENVAPRTPWLGAFVPYTPLHALLLAGAASPLVCTSGNLSEEPICTTTEEAVATLSEIADGILTHDRPIVRPMDDSVVRVSAKRTVVMRRARGYAPRAVGAIDPRVTVLALGGHQKSTITLGHGGVLVPSQHLGDMDTVRARDLLEATVQDLCALFDVTPRIIACDMHPEYASSVLAERLEVEWSVPLVRVQHHHAHVAAGMAEHSIDPEQEVLGLAWDGAGFGEDGTIWGGEALLCRGVAYRRFATLTSFPLLGGDRAAREPRRPALGLLFEVAFDHVPRHAEEWFGEDLDTCIRILERRLAPMCSSVGRLFDALAALLGISQRTTFEAQAAIELEHLASAAKPDGAYPLPLVERGAELLLGDTRPFVHAILEDLYAGVDRSRIARRFHEALIDFGASIAERAAIRDVVLSGGAFQNRVLVEGLEVRLERAGFTVHVPATVPANDGGLSIGQAWLAAMHTLPDG
ncbi:MAG TPA: carbamoyltransferase HypF [Labilithrix sp.]|nr:carbamoyltransferase HypF [Labilithrix sp.]